MGGHRCLVSIQIQVRGGPGSCPLGWGQDEVGGSERQLLRINRGSQKAPLLRGL